VSGPRPTVPPRAFRRLSFYDWMRSGSRARRLFRVVGVITVMSVLIPGTAFAIVLGSYLFLPLPAALPDEHGTPASQISVLYAADGTRFGEFRFAEQSVPVPSEQIPDTIRDAVIAAEDHDFFTHDGVDFEAVGRAIMANLTAGRIVQGGSTISQQLVKNLYFENRGRSLIRKAQEALLAAQLEREFSKEEILVKYLNTVYLGESTFGVEAASQSYFRHPASELTLSESALLAGVIPAPSLYSPRANPVGAEERRLRVLDQVEQHGLATPEEVAAARAETPTVHPPAGFVGQYPYFYDYVRLYLEEHGYSDDLVFKGGLKIETTLDPALQEQAEKVVRETLPNPEDPHAALVSVEPQTGFVRALVGGRDFEALKVNLALGPEGFRGPGRQAGSSFKPFVLTRALEAGLKPEKVYPAPASVQPEGFAKPVKNFGNSGYGSANLRKATAASINTVFVQLILDVGVEETAELATKLGITTFDFEKPIYGGIAIGTQEVMPIDMASAFSVFAARGMRAEPTPILRITTADGKVLEDNTNPKRKRVLAEDVADTVNDVLRDVVEGGTGRAAKIGRPAAGKTGTSQDFQNAWFVGYTPALSTAVWMGYPEANIPMKNIHGVRSVTGGSLPAKMWAAFMKKALADVPKTEFTDPAPLDSLRERALRKQRGGFDLGNRKFPGGFPDEGSYYEPSPKPEAPPPPPDESTTTTTPGTSSSSSSTTTSSIPFVTTTTGGGLFG